MWKLISDNDKQLFEAWSWAEMFTKEECDRIIKYGTSLNSTTGVVGDHNEDFSIRKSSVCWFDNVNEETEWIYRRCTDFVIENNNKYFGYDLDFIEPLQFTIYDSQKSFYGRHVDTNLHTNPNAVRKLTFAIQLSSPEEYDGGDFYFHCDNTPQSPTKKCGLGVFFPSYTLHEVTPVTRGTRYSLVGWVCGKAFR